ncbi:hypothetical protein BN12_100020 [Nostocoides japonicum T1-X7]|uniref:Uncharacterized protein n=1 Tax=Nostocoides japonicum T1-X7 TaxID=1194083 RepID=A0A077LSX2_9MICO|nr:hypothetical protein BN12_100020 [Tetrasphaera japonica T1-X7]
MVHKTGLCYGSDLNRPKGSAR